MIAGQHDEYARTHARTHTHTHTFPHARTRAHAHTRRVRRPTHKIAGGNALPTCSDTLSEVFSRYRHDGNTAPEHVAGSGVRIEEGRVEEELCKPLYSEFALSRKLFVEHEPAATTATPQHRRNKTQRPLSVNNPPPRARARAFEAGVGMRACGRVCQRLRVPAPRGVHAALVCAVEQVSHTNTDTDRQKRQTDLEGSTPSFFALLSRLSAPCCVNFSSQSLARGTFLSTRIHTAKTCHAPMPCSRQARTRASAYTTHTSTHAHIHTCGSIL